jgi:hypothetical protein
MKNRNLISLISIIIALTVVAACNKSGSSPTATAKAFYDAVKNKDVQGMKNTMSKGSLDLIESVAKARGQSLDDVLSKGPGGNFPDTFESKEETINGDTATLKVKSKKEEETINDNTSTPKEKSKEDRWETLNFVKENGQWKIAFDKR